MKTGFKNRLESPEGKEVPSPWNFEQPPYDERSSCYINAGTHWGTGKTQPIGTKGNPKSPDAIPTGRVNTMDLYANGKKAYIK